MASFYRKKIELAGDLKPSKLFIGEGDTESFFIDKFLDLRKASPSENYVYCIRGLGSFQRKLEVVAKQNNFRFVNSLFFMLDAEDNLQGRLAAIAHGCRKIEFMNIQNVEAAGIYKKDQKSLGVFVSPGTGSNGRIEDVILQEIMAKQQFGCIRKYVECMANDDGIILDAKSVVQTYISAVNGSLCGAGRAFEAGVLDPLDPAYESVTSIIDTLIQT